MINLLCSNKGRSEKGNSFVRNLFRFRTFLLRREKMGKTCVICGKPSGMYPLCREHLEMKNRGEVVKCPDCGTWHLAKDKCKCATVEETKEEPVQPSEHNSDSELTCIICGQPSNGKHFCHNCWTKYKDKAVDIRITHCNVVQILDEYGNKTKKAKDGRFVRSLSEKIILDYFFDNYIRVVYEKTIPYTNEKGEEKELHPDFYLKDYDLYIEFNGLTNKNYLSQKGYANKIYQNKGLKVEILESKDIDDVESTMERILSKYQKRA